MAETVALAEADSADLWAAGDLIPTFRASDKDDQTENYGLRCHAFSDLWPEYRTAVRTLTVTSGSFAYSASDHALPVSGSRLAAPELAWLRIQARVTSLNTSASWVMNGFFSPSVDTSPRRWRSWHHSRREGSVTIERIGHESGLSATGFRTLGTTRIPSTAAGGWALKIRASDRALALDEQGNAPHAQYTFIVQCAYALI